MKELNNTPQKYDRIKWALNFIERAFKYNLFSRLKNTNKMVLQVVVGGNAIQANMFDGGFYWEFYWVRWRLRGNN